MSRPATSTRRGGEGAKNGARSSANQPLECNVPLRERVADVHYTKQNYPISADGYLEKHLASHYVDPGGP